MEIFLFCFVLHFENRHTHHVFQAKSYLQVGKVLVTYLGLCML